MHDIQTYLPMLRNKVFKLLPMREAYDNGEENHLSAYTANLTAVCAGALANYPELSETREMVETLANLSYLADNTSIEFAKWRSLVLRTTRLVQTVVLRYEGG